MKKISVSRTPPPVDRNKKMRRKKKSGSSSSSSSSIPHDLITLRTKTRKDRRKQRIVY